MLLGTPMRRPLAASVCEWAGQASKPSPQDHELTTYRAAVVSENERHVRYVQHGAVPVRSRNETKCPLAGCSEPSTAISQGSTARKTASRRSEPCDGYSPSQ